MKAVGTNAEFDSYFNFRAMNCDPALTNAIELMQQKYWDLYVKLLDVNSNNCSATEIKG